MFVYYALAYVDIDAHTHKHAIIGFAKYRAPFKQSLHWYSKQRGMFGTSVVLISQVQATTISHFASGDTY